MKLFNKKDNQKKRNYQAADDGQSQRKVSAFYCMAVTAVTFVIGDSMTAFAAK